MVALALAAAGAIAVGACAVAAAVQGFVFEVIVVLVGVLAYWYFECTRTCATSSSTSLRVPATRKEITAEWLTLAFQESGLLAGDQRVARVHLANLGGKPATGSGADMSAATFEYSGNGDLDALPKNAVIKLVDTVVSAKLQQMKSNLWIMVTDLARRSLDVDRIRREHGIYRYLNSAAVRTQPWALKAPALYFEATEDMPTEYPSILAVFLFGAWRGSALPRVRSILIMENLNISGLESLPVAKGPDGPVCSIGLDEKKAMVIEPLARWHAANWGCPDDAAAALLFSRVFHEPLKDACFLAAGGNMWTTFARFKLRRTPRGSCPLVDALSAALEKVYRPRGMRLVVQTLSRKGVMAALRGLERAYNPVLVPYIRERLYDGATAARNTTLVHGDLHLENIRLWPRKEAGHDLCFFDFGMSGKGFAVYDLLQPLFQFHLPKDGLLEAYHAALSAAMPPSVHYSWGDFLEDWSLAVADKAGENLMLMGGIPQFFVTYPQAGIRLGCLTLAHLEDVLHSDTKVGAALRQACGEVPPREPPLEANVGGAGKGQPAGPKAPAPHAAKASGKGSPGGAGKGQGGNAASPAAAAAGKGGAAGKAGHTGKGQAGPASAPAAAKAGKGGGVRACKTPGCPFQATWHDTLCCVACGHNGTHGGRCEKKEYCLPVGAPAARVPAGPGAADEIAEQEGTS